MSTTPTDTKPNQQAAIRRWTLDPARSTVEFRVRHIWGLITDVPIHVNGVFSRSQSARRHR